MINSAFRTISRRITIVALLVAAIGERHGRGGTGKEDRSSSVRSAGSGIAASRGRRTALVLTGVFALAAVLPIGPGPQSASAATYLDGSGEVWAEHNVTYLDLQVRLRPIDENQSQDLAYTLWAYDYRTGLWANLTAFGPGGWVMFTWRPSVFDTVGFITDTARFAPQSGHYYLLVKYAWRMSFGWVTSDWEVPCVKGYWTTACQNPFFIYPPG